MRRYFVPMITAVISAAVVISCGGDGEVGALTLNLSLPEGWESRLDMSVLSAPASTPYIGTVRVKLDCAGDTRTWDLPWSDRGADFGQMDLEGGCDVQVQTLTAGRVIMNRVHRNVVVANGSAVSVDIQLEEAGGFSFAGTLTHPRQFHSAVDTGGKVLVLGGSLSTRTVEEVIYTGEGFSTAAFGCSLNEYRTMQKALYDRTGNRIFVFQGSTLDSLYEVVDVGNEECTTRLLAAEKKEYFSNINGQEIYLFGGMDTNDDWITNSTKINTKSFDESIVSTMGITSEKQDVTCVTTNASIVCLGGMIGTLYTDEIDQFDLEYEVAKAPKVLSDQKKSFSITELSDGRLLGAGGINASGLLSDIEIIDLQNDQITLHANALNFERVNHTETLLPNNKVLFVGGGVLANISVTGEIFDPSTGESVELPWRMRVPRNGHTATLLPDGRVLIIGGNPGDPTMEVFNPPIEPGP